MPTVMKVSSQGQIRIPKHAMKMLDILPGDYVEVDVVDGQVVLKPRKLIDPGQGWYWTKEWQKQEAAVDEELAEGRCSPDFHTAEDGLKWLEK